MDTARPDLDAVAGALGRCRSVLERAFHHLGRWGTRAAETHQAIAYDLAHGAAVVEIARAMLGYGAKGRLESERTCAFAAEAIWDLSGRLAGRDEQWGVASAELVPALAAVSPYRDPEFLATLAGEPGPRHLGDELGLVAQTFRRFSEERVAPRAQQIHRDNGDIPEDIIDGLAALGAFGLSIPERYGGFAGARDQAAMSMVVATEELSRGSLGIGGSLLTRSEILARALLKGGTESQRHRWLPRLANGEVMAAIAVTEPDHGSDVAAISLSAKRTIRGWSLSGTKTWSTFAGRADVLMVLARSDPDRSLGHRGLSIFLVPKQRANGRSFSFTQPGGGTLTGRAIDTIGYRGMHSYELFFNDWYVPADHVIGEESGVGRGFFLQMEGFQGGRLQTAARAVGVMQAAYEAALDYAEHRVAFGTPIATYQLTRVKLGRMVAIIQACRQYAYEVAQMMARSEGALEASMIKAYACRAAEWVSREAMQIHGGIGYAEDTVVSRLFVDARVLSIFEGTDEVLALRVIAPRLIQSWD